ncbi:hypothetical protein LCGC14_2582080 [marine sediment metagenome]|uniref:Uncharacterized protein n=1 Tax=marine sediment metagenome TaxID=412755 RepID=A0A0F8VAQ7_9ZZZZ
MSIRNDFQCAQQIATSLSQFGLSKGGNSLSQLLVTGSIG